MRWVAARVLSQRAADMTALSLRRVPLLGLAAIALAGLVATGVWCGSDDQKAHTLRRLMTRRALTSPFARLPSTSLRFRST